MNPGEFKFELERFCITHLRQLSTVNELRAGRPWNRGSIPCKEGDLPCHGVQTPLQPTQVPAQWVLGALTPAVERPAREGDQSPAFNDDFKNRYCK